MANEGALILSAVLITFFLGLTFVMIETDVESEISLASASAVLPLSSLTFSEAPAFTKAFTALHRLLSTASCKAVRPS